MAEVGIDRVCMQPSCPLRDEGVGSAFVREIVLRVLAGEEVEAVIPSARAIERRGVCARCIELVMKDLKPILTLAQRDRTIEVGHLSWRRRRRRR
jgi:hypothetical protein